MSRTRSRFNLLLLEDGEYLLDEYTAHAFVWVPAESELKLDQKLRGKLRICTRGVSFEPEDARQALLRWNYRTTLGRATALQAQKELPAEVSEAVAAEAKPRDAFAFQPSNVIRAKVGGSAVPLDVKPYPTAAAPSAASETDGSKSKLSKSKSYFGSTGAKGDSETPSKDAGALQAGRATVVIALLHTALSSVLPTVQQLWDIQQSCIDAATGKERARIHRLISARIDGPFDPSLLSDFREKMLLPASPNATVVERVFPLVSVPGRLMVTAAGVYFQPVSVNSMAGSDPVHKWRLRDVVRVQRRTRLQRQVGLELKLADDAPGATAAGTDLTAAGLISNSKAASRVFFACQTPAARDQVYTLVLNALRDREKGKSSNNFGFASPMKGGASAAPSGSSSASSGSAAVEYDDALGDYSPGYISSMTRRWLERSLSNFEYLSFLNDAAGRTFVDFSQYPVFPWVLSDYQSSALELDDPGSWPTTYRDLSKPIGALNEQRLKSFKDRYAQMPRGEEAVAQGSDPPFLYGTHYSTPAYVLYFLVRHLPEHMLRLQAGRFDAPDRLFHDVASSWTGVTGINSDLKELIPEFYDSDGSFLLLRDGLNLGVRQNGRRVGDVALPPWAYDAGDFIRQCRDALESEYVSQHLHGWIDLIFGHKASGAAAIEHDNLFHHLSYEGAVDVEGLTDLDARAAVQSQIAEFGQTPHQLFTEPHPARPAAGAAVPAPVPVAVKGAPSPAPAPSVSGSSKAVPSAKAADVSSSSAASKETGAAATVGVLSSEDGSSGAVSTDDAAVDAAPQAEATGQDGTAAAVQSAGEAAEPIAAAVESSTCRPAVQLEEASPTGSAAMNSDWAVRATEALIGSTTAADRQSTAAGMTAVTSCTTIPGPHTDGQGTVGPQLTVTTCMDGVVRLHRVSAAGQLELLHSLAPSSLRPGPSGQYRSHALSHAALAGRDTQLPLRCSVALPSGRDGAAAAVTAPHVAVAGMDGRLYILAVEQEAQPVTAAAGGEQEQTAVDGTEPKAPTRHVMRVVAETVVCDAQVMCMVILSLAASDTDSQATGQAGCMLLAGASDGSIHALAVAPPVQNADAPATSTPWAVGKPVAVCNRTGQPVTRLAAKTGVSSTEQGDVPIHIVAAGDAHGRVWVMHVHPAPGAGEASAMQRPWTVSVPAPSAAAGSAVRAAVIHTFSAASSGFEAAQTGGNAMLTTLQLERLARTDVTLGNGPACGITGLHWVSMRPPSGPKPAPSSVELEEGEVLDDHHQNGGHGHNGRVLEEGEVLEDGEDDDGGHGHDESSSGGAKAAPALLATTSVGQVAVVYLSDPVDEEEDGSGPAAAPPTASMILCGSLTTGDVIRCSEVVQQDSSILDKSQDPELGLIVGTSTSSLRQWPLGGLLSNAAQALLDGYMAGGLEQTVPYVSSGQDGSVTAVDIVTSMGQPGSALSSGSPALPHTPQTPATPSKQPSGSASSGVAITAIACTTSTSGAVNAPVAGARQPQLLAAGSSGGLLHVLQRA